MLENAGRCFAQALIETDRRNVAALLRATARYLEGAIDDRAGAATLTEQFSGGAEREAPALVVVSG
jgi:hypothetical protein